MMNDTPIPYETAKSTVQGIDVEGAAQEGYELEHEYLKALRDEFAGQALAGLLSKGVMGTHTEISVMSYDIADAMLAERQRRG